MQEWIVELFRCPAPDCGGRLEPGEAGSQRDGLLRCDSCGAVHPYLGGVPVLVPDPSHYLASYRDAVIAALAEAGVASRAAMDLVDDFASQSRHAEPMRFSDDWVEGEGRGRAQVQPIVGTSRGDDVAQSFRAFLAAARRTDPHDVLLELMGEGDLGDTVEVGPGAGDLSGALRARASRLVVADLSLRAVLRARRTARSKRDADAPVAGVVMDAEELPLVPGAVRTLVAANVVDLLERPGAFLAAAAEALPEDGRLLLSTPAPDLGLTAGGDEVLAELVRAAGLEVRATVDGLPWVRAHGPRHFQIYFVQALSVVRA